MQLLWKNFEEGRTLLLGLNKKFPFFRTITSNPVLTILVKLLETKVKFTNVIKKNFILKIFIDMF